MLLMQDQVWEYMDNLWVSQSCRVRQNEYSVCVCVCMCVHTCMMCMCVCVHAHTHVYQCLLLLNFYGPVHCSWERPMSNGPNLNKHVQENRGLYFVYITNDSVLIDCFCRKPCCAR